jgi:hypothetical protein
MRALLRAYLAKCPAPGPKATRETAVRSVWKGSAGERAIVATMQNRETCVDCGARSPETTTDHTLVSSMGWRLMRGQTADGSWHAEWRCGRCWTAHKTKAKGLAADVTHVRASTASPERTQTSAHAARPASARTSDPKAPEVKIAPNAPAPLSLAAPGRSLFRGSR